MSKEPLAGHPDAVWGNRQIKFLRREMGQRNVTYRKNVASAVQKNIPAMQPLSKLVSWISVVVAAVLTLSACL